MRILGELSEIEIDVNWVNKPIESLKSIFRVWMPQTAADHEMRLKAVNMLLDKYPKVGWTVCLQQFGNPGRQVGDYNHKPKWRPDGSGFGEPIQKREPILTFVREIVRLALDRPSYTVEMLCDLVARLHALVPEDQARVWEIINKWHRSGVGEEEVAQLRDKIRVTFLTRWAHKRFNGPEQAAMLEKPKRSMPNYKLRTVETSMSGCFVRDGLICRRGNSTEMRWTSEYVSNGYKSSKLTL